MVDLASESLFNAVRYCYLIADNDFYNINVKDIFRIGLSDITNPDCFKNLGLSLDETKIGEMGTEHYRENLSILVLPVSFSRKTPCSMSSKLKERFLPRMRNV